MSRVELSSIINAACVRLKLCSICTLWPIPSLRGYRQFGDNVYSALEHLRGGPPAKPPAAECSFVGHITATEQVTPT